MCESNAYLRKGETDEVVLLNVDRAYLSRRSCH